MTTHPPTREESSETLQRSESPVSPEQLLELLGDEYTREVLAAVAEQPRTGSEVIEAASVSKATAYRRLDDLQSAGLVESSLLIDPDGHHREQFRAVFERAHLACDGGLVDGDLELVSGDQSQGVRVVR
jgi:DNA-binding transcriptional ArsR family regulator